MLAEESSFMPLHPLLHLLPYLQSFIMTFHFVIYTEGTLCFTKVIINSYQAESLLHSLQSQMHYMNAGGPSINTC